jgi:hypothetical protein
MAGKLIDLIATLGAIEEAVATRAPRQIAEQTVRELQEAGPAWSGTFRNAWRINPGDTPVAATVGRPAGFTYEPGDVPDPEPQREIKVPSLGFGRRFVATATTNKTLYTIGNAAKHRMLAMDLEPGREPPRTAPQDWFETYMNGGAFGRTVRVRLDQAIRSAAYAKGRALGGRFGD